jgi:cupin 2 domain-containing protein
LFAVTPGNLFDRLPGPVTGEVFERLLRHRNLLIERIVSSDRPEPTRYDQGQDEWILLLQGRATLELAGETLSLAPGDHLFIPAHTPHQVLSTSREPPCLWLAVHLYPDAAPTEPTRGFG